MYSYKNLSGAHQELKVFDYIKSSRQSVAAVTLAVALRVLPTIGLPLSVFNCISNNQIDLTEIENNGKATQTEWLSNSNIIVNGGVRWNNPFGSPNSGSASPTVDFPNKYLRHLLDQTVQIRIWRLDQSGNRMSGEYQDLGNPNANGRVTDLAVNGSANGTLTFNNYPNFTTAGVVYGFQLEYLYLSDGSNGAPTSAASNHTNLLSEFSSAVMNPAASVNRNANLSAAPLFIIDQKTPPANDDDYSKTDFYLGFASGYTLPSSVGRIVGEGTSKREISLDASEVFEGGLTSNGNYLANNTPVVVAKLSTKMKTLIIEKGSVVLSLPGYPRVSLVKTQIKTFVSNAFGSGTASNANTGTVNQNYSGVDNSSRWTAQVLRDSNNNQYVQYTIPSAVWTQLATTYGIPVGQLRIMVVRGDTVNSSDTVANNLVAGGYSSASPLATVTAYENLKIDVPVNLTDGSVLSTPVTNPVSGLGAEIAQASSGNTVLRFRTSDSTINAERIANDGNIRIIILQAGVSTPMFIDTVNLSINSDRKAQKDHEITEYEQ